MVLVPAGDVVVGIDEATLRDLVSKTELVHAIPCLVSAYPQEKRRVERFFIDVHELTNRQWNAYVAAGGAAWPANAWNPWDLNDSRPVGSVSYDQAVEYATKIGKRLPSEAEWTRAARGAQTPLYVWGNDWDKEKCANGRTARGKRVPVMKYQDDVSWCGVYDLMGNVCEWTTSPFLQHKGFRSIELESADFPQRKFSPPFSHFKRVVRGGTVEGRGFMNSCFIRQAFAPSSQFELIGFRCAKDVCPGKDIFQASLLEQIDLDTLQDTIEWDDIGAQEVLTTTSLDGVAMPEVYDAFVIAHVKNQPLDRADSSTPIAYIYTSRDLHFPSLKAGCYAIHFQAGGEDGAPRLLFMSSSGEEVTRIPVRLGTRGPLKKSRLTYREDSQQTEGHRLGRFRYEFTIPASDEAATYWSITFKLPVGWFEEM